jgi:hypothetical protein
VLNRGLNDAQSGGTADGAAGYGVEDRAAGFRGSARRPSVISRKSDARYPHAIPWESVEKL